jgi:hypothetical protein
MTGNGFIDAVSGIVNRGCHNPPCGTGPLDGGMERADNFKKVLLALFGSALPDLPNSGSSGNENPPNGSGNPNNDGSIDSSSTAYYPDYNSNWSLGKCINDGIPPLGRPNYETLEECCSKAYGGQASGVCLGSVPGGSSDETDDTGTNGDTATTSTTSSTAIGDSTSSTTSAGDDSETPNDDTSPGSDDDSTGSGSTAYYPDYNPIWSLGKCINDGAPPPGRPNYESLIECCNMAYGGQASGACLGTTEDDVSDQSDSPVSDLWYPDYNPLWALGSCTNALPFENGRPTYDNQLECCQNAYRGQASGKCLADIIPNNLTGVSSPTQPDKGEQWYADYNPLWSFGKCVNKSPVPDNRLYYSTQSECCKKVYGGQASGSCLEGLDNENASIQSNGSFADSFTSYLQSQRFKELMVYSCGSTEIPQSSRVIDISYDYEFSVPKTVRADLALTELKRRMMEHVASEFGCQNTTPRKLRRTKEEEIVGIQSSGWSDEIDTKTAQCRQPSGSTVVCVPVVGHLVAFLKTDNPSVITYAKTRIFEALAQGEYTSESIQNVEFIGVHSNKPILHEMQQEPVTRSQSWVFVVASLFLVMSAVAGMIVVFKRRKSSKIQAEEQECFEKGTIDHTHRLSDYSFHHSELDDRNFDSENDDDDHEDGVEKYDTFAGDEDLALPVAEVEINPDNSDAISEFTDQVVNAPDPDGYDAASPNEVKY